MKKVMTFMLIFAMLFALSITAFAEETAALSVTEGAEPWTSVTDAGELIGAEGSEDAKDRETLVSRISEFAFEHKQIIILVLGFFVTVIQGIRTLKKNGKGFALVKSVLETIYNKLNGVEVSSSALTSKMDEVIESNNKLAAEYERFRVQMAAYMEAEDERAKVESGLCVEETAALEMLYLLILSANIPEGVKNTALLKYSKCMQSLENDEFLKNMLKNAREGVDSAFSTFNTKVAVSGNTASDELKESDASDRQA